MFHHVVLMQFTAKANQDFLDKVEAFSGQIRKSARNLRGYAFKPNLASRRDGLNWAVVSSFATSADHDTYQVSPVHQQMKAFMMPYIARIVVCEIDEAKP